ncbi:uncharacterized protein LOC143056126 [Mytilus galloprovincialis]|uniref:uncharacterized protein LOC143056126 n=1 Tax=Mytilus galloprovincialis TaxID=29158 RepID=UPI003F7C37DD
MLSFISFFPLLCRSVYRFDLKCKEGWAQENPYSDSCDNAICNGKSGPNACNIRYTIPYCQKTRTGTICNSGGSCSYPDICSDCNDGFYNDGPFCRVCGTIAHCNHRRCETSNDHHCVWCEGEIIDKQYWRAYIKSPNKRKCQQACSWRTDSTRCFPGTCTNELASKCICNAYFSGRHCENIDNTPTILYNYCKFYDKDGHNILENDGNWNTTGHPTKWTNYDGYTKVSVDLTAKYFQPKVDITDHYVKNYRIGLIEGKVTLYFCKGSTCKKMIKTCPRMNRDAPISSTECKFTFDINAWSFKHNDSVVAEFSSTNGGFVTVANRDKIQYNVRDATYYYSGKNLTRQFEYRWDTEPPYHCSETPGLPCTPFLDLSDDITETPNMTFWWGGWSDDLSGIDYYKYDLYYLGVNRMNNDAFLVDGAGAGGYLVYQSVPITESSGSLHLNESGMYSLHLLAFDKAGNYKLGRNIFLYDNQSKVEKQKKKTTYSSTASKNTSYTWVTSNTNHVQVDWKDRFINFRHKYKKWLNPVQTYTANEIYEDLYGERTNVRINNVNGIVNFQVSYEVESTDLKHTSFKDSRPFTSVSDIENQFDVLTLNWTDGDRLTATVKAIDILDKTDQETIIVYRDTTPPIIENLWMTKGDRLNISVHSLEDFTKMTIEWVAYDIHSGLDSVFWRLYDSMTADHDDPHGHEDVIAQGHAKNLTHCEDKYSQYPRGANCYCTPFHGCFHRHFQIKPEIKKHGGLREHKSYGTHEYDYFIMISVTSIANLTTVLTRKISIDISPPHSGVVHDGLQGNPEIDYQQGMDLNAYWDQFFDRESGVFFYQYIVNTSCADQTDFVPGGSNIIETYNTFGSHTVNGDGTYYFTVVAYNRALDPSEPVCSDGVTIDSSVPGVKEVVVTDSIITGGLVKDQYTLKYYIIGPERIRRLIPNPTADCITKATALNCTDIFPLMRTNNGSIVEVDSNVFCSNSSSSPSVIGLTLFKSSLLEMSWVPLDIPAKVFDYEVGFSSTPGSAAPDIMAFKSTKQHAHVRVMHTNIPDGSQFFIIIKTISKSNVEGITTLGPCFMDTTPPQIVGGSGIFTVQLLGDYLVTTWPGAAVSDSEELFTLDYQFAIGHNSYGTDVQGYQPLKSGSSCVLSQPPSCTAVNVSDLDWYLHGNHTYYVSVKVTNTAGQTAIQSSGPYIHDVQLPAEGVVLDIETQDIPTHIQFKDIQDLDFQTATNIIAARWSGFAHPHLNVTYRVSIGTTIGGNDVVSAKDVGISLLHKETGLSLTPYQKYYFTVTAKTSAGNVSKSSDGVTIVIENDVLSGVSIFDGEPCNMTNKMLEHHMEDHRLYCSDGIQMSTNSLKAYWTIPDIMKSYTTDAYVAIEKGVGNNKNVFLADYWSIFRDFLKVSSVLKMSIDDLTLNPGVKYRVVLKLCAETICFSNISTDGVTVIANPPVTGDVTVEHFNSKQTNGDEKLMVSFAQFYDPDIEDMTEKYTFVDKYEFAITDNSVQGQIYMVWTKLNYTAIGHQISFQYVLNGTMDFSRCKRFSIRGYNKAKLYSTVSTEIKDCNAFNPILIQPNIVIDAVGEPDATAGIGRPVFLEQNALWTEADRDYTPYKNVISAVWPTLRHKNYDYAIIEVREVDVTTYYRQVNQLQLKIPCDHPDRIICGHTANGFMNVEFTKNELLHGTRYTVCVHADATKIQHETWIEDLSEINECSDGIIVDLTPPEAGRLWIGTNLGQIYQTTTTNLYVNWDGFRDVEEYGVGPHSTGIKEYILGIGTTPGGNDIYAFENIGIVQHKALSNLNLQNGYKYYATLKAVDFANRENLKVSDPITIEYTPPERSDKPITLSSRLITTITEINPCWKGVFIDLESGIDYYLWSVGSEPGYTDMMSYIKVVDRECAITDKNNPLTLQDGHYYYINVLAFNKAGLSSLATSWAFQVDTTPPTPGQVYDGNKRQLTGSIKDIDYQTETKVLYAYWEGFHESHSTIKDYFVSVGTCPSCEDVLQQQAIGITYDFTLENIHLGTGLRYYTTVTGCNTADMCTTVTSDGVIIDNSPPTAGVVQDGTGFYDISYQSMVIYLSAKWYGFDDPQSGLQKYVWRAGLKPGYGDIVSPIELHLTETATLLNSTSYNLDLPVNKRIFVTVRAYNKAGLWCESSSNGFIVDNTPPVISKPPTFAADFGIKGLTQIYRTSMKVEWAVDDEESHIKRQYLSIKSHIGGEFMLSSQSVNGIARSYVFTGLDLHDGVTYYVNLISCNSAEICIMSTSQGMYVDSTPPSRGTFAVATDHAVNHDLARKEDGWMAWETYAVYLAWLGFSDIHSQIDHYMVTVGSSYMAKDLTKNHKAKYIHTDGNRDHGDEGKVQLYKVETEKLTDYDELFITVWAVNKVGLRSHLVHSAFKKTPPKSLDLIRRCDALSCEGHCICAPQDQRCPDSLTIGVCNDVSDSVFTGTQYSLLLVEDTNGYSTDDQRVTASNTVLRAAWQISQQYPSKPNWYEWSVGYADESTPLGIFDTGHDTVWQDAGQLMDAVFTIGQGKDVLENAMLYSVFVKVWYSTNVYAVFKTNGIYVMTKAPVLATVRGTMVTEKVQGTKVKDDDYIRIGRPITFSWKEKFMNAEATIENYRLYLSSFPGGYDIRTIHKNLPGTATGYNMSRITLVPGIKYYSNVIAYNYAGAHTTSTSDGFIVDHVIPSAGIVYDGLGILDKEYQNSTDNVAAHWHGFIDTESGIQSYFWCVGNTTHVHRIYSNSECSVHPWTNVGLRVSASKNLSTEILQGKTIYNKVYAIDGVGRRSSIVVSDGVIIDITPPIPEKFIIATELFGNNTSFENTGGEEVKFENVSSTDICMISKNFHPSSWTPSPLTCMAVVSSEFNLAKDGRSFLFIRGSANQCIETFRAGYLYKISFFSSHLPITDSVGANKEGFIQLDRVKHIFLIYTKPYRHDGHGLGDSRQNISWHAHTFFFKATNTHANITIGSTDKTTGIFLDNISVQEVNLTTSATSGNVLGHVIYLHAWSSIHGTWSFADPESPIIDYTWAIGYSEGGTQIQPFRSVGLMNFAVNNNVTLVHNTYIYVTTIATNAAGLRGVSFSDPILVDLTPPEFEFVNDGAGTDEDAWELNEVRANWAVADPESGILLCKWAIGYQPGGNDLLPYTVVTTTTAYKEFPYSLLTGHTIYTTLTCENHAGLSSVMSSDGVKISDQPPSVAAAVVENLPLSMTEYNPRDSYQGVIDNFRLKWTGFDDNIGVERYEVIYNNGGTSELMFFADVQDVLYAHFTKMSIKEGSNNISVQAINKLFKPSSKVTSYSTIDISSPKVETTETLSINWINKKVVVSWENIFTSDNDLFYEVSSGSTQGGVNIMQWQETRQTSITFGIPSSVSVTTGLPVHITVTAISVSGFSAVKKGSFKLP